MKFMNEYEIDDRARQYSGHPLLGPATQTLSNLRDAVNENSDGWPYWKRPVRSAARLIELIVRDGTSKYRFDDERNDVTITELKAAYKPLKAFRTVTGLRFDIVEPIDAATSATGGRHEDV